MCIDKCKFNGWGIWQWGGRGGIHRKDCMVVTWSWSITTLVIYFKDAWCYFCQFINNCINNIRLDVIILFNDDFFSTRSLQPLPPPLIYPCIAKYLIWFDQLLVLEETRILSTRVEDCGALLHGKQHGVNYAYLLWLEFAFF